MLGSTIPELEPLDNGSCELTILVFGPHVGTNFSKEHIENMIRPLAQGQHREWILETVDGLAGYWDALIAKMPEVAEVLPQVPQSLADLSAWFRHGPPAGEYATLPLPALGPVVVLTQLVQYWQYLELTHKGERGPTVDVLASRVAASNMKSKGGDSVTSTTISLGYCSGLVPAAAVASAGNRLQFEEYAAVAMRLSVLIGGLTSAREAWDVALGRGASVSLATAWVGPQQAEDVVRITEELAPDAYIATIYDEARAILKTTEQTAPLLQKRLRAAGVIAIKMDIEGGHVHSPHPDIQRTTDTLVQLANSMPGLQFADLDSLVLPTYDNRGDGRRILADHSYGLTESVLRGIFVQQCQWYGSFSAVVDKEPTPFVVNFGPERCVPPTWMSKLGNRQVHFEDIHKKAQGLGLLRSPTIGLNPSRTASVSHQQQQQPQKKRPAGPTESVDLLLGNDDRNSIAVIGMSVKTAGADDLAEYANMIKTGQSQHVAITRDMDRIMMDTLFHDDDAPDRDQEREWYGCFVRDPDAFDHKFFKRSPREAAAMDPQGRQALEAAYQAVEQSGYFQELLHGHGHGYKSSAGGATRHVGVYLGSGGVDYEENTASHEPSAFTTTGILKSFVAGRISHYFGWTGPSMTLNTACSSSAVAIHTACRSILSGECTAALAGGSQAVTKMAWFKDLAAGSFLSPTGQCKPFDDGADGYCRGEGYGWVFLKRLSDAVRDGNPVLAVIPSTAVNQNENSTSLFVPNASSLSNLFREVLSKANVAPRDVSLVEAHGTGTPVGDPVEYDSIRGVLGGPVSGRQTKLAIGSVKGHIGHTEAASGVLGLIKVIMMMRGAFIPPQASFRKISSRIDERPDDMMEVATTLRTWQDGHKIALLNNYGASGSNASLVVAQRPKSLSQSLTSRNVPAENYRYPFWITGLDSRAISAYAAKMASYCRSLPTKDTRTLADLSFAVNRQSNRGLAQGFVFSCQSMAELEDRLEQAASAGSGEVAAAQHIFTPVQAERPVVLCFGGQVSLFVGLDRKLYDDVAIFRRHLDSCDTAVTSLGLESIYPGIFSQEPVRDTVKLQTMLFAMQYACAKAWMDCGLEAKIAAVVGHSFGEITALCISGVLSLQDTVKLVAARAELVRDRWGADPGAMVAVEVDVDGEDLVHDLVREVNSAPGSDGSAGIACYNGPRSYTLAGSTAAVDAAEEVLQGGKFSAIKKSKRLSVTNAFHSALVTDLVDDLGRVGKSLTFHKPVIPVELCTKEAHNNDGDTLDWTFVPRHMREPVFFDHAVQRLAKRYPQTIFLEAGSNSTITVMAARALAQSKTATDGHYFQAVSISNINDAGPDTGFGSLTDATIALWRQGLRVSFWAHHPQQTLEYEPLLLPPYQFNKSPASRHWLQVKSPLEAVRKAANTLLAQRGQAKEGGTHKTLPLWDFVGHYQDKGCKKARFRINTASDQYRRFSNGHVIAQTAPICPGTLEHEMIVGTLFSLHPDWAEDGMLPVLHDLTGEAPICADPSRAVYIDLWALDDNNKSGASSRQFQVRIYSVEDNTAATQHQQSQSRLIHAEARVDVRSPTDAAYAQEFAHFERLVSHARCAEVLKLGLDEDGVESLQGRQVYRAFAPVVDYAEPYRGVRYVVGRGAECAGRVRLDRRHRQLLGGSSSWLDTPLSDCFAQVAGLWVNVMTDCPPGDMYVGTGCQLSMRSPRHKVADRAGTDDWHVYARHLRREDDGASTYTTDVFVFDAATGLLVEVMLGVGYRRVSRQSMSNMLAHMTKDESVLRIKKGLLSAPEEVTAKPKQGPKPSQGKRTKNKQTSPSAPASGRRDITDQVRNLVSELSGVDVQDMTLDSNMADLGIDSLMNMELGRGIERTFHCTVDQAEQLEATTLGLFVRCVERALFGPDAARGDERPLSPTHDTDWDVLDDDDDGSAETSSSIVMVVQDSVSPRTAATPSSSSDQYHDDEEEESAFPKDAETKNLPLSPSIVLSSFGEVKMRTDDYLREWKIDQTEKAMMADNGRLLSALVLEALSDLGCDLGAAAGGQRIDRVPFLPQHKHLVDAVYQFLERDARLVDIDPASGQLTRTRVPVPPKPSTAIFEELLAQHPDLGEPIRLVYHACKHLGGVLSGKTDGIKVLFGTPEARARTEALYCDYRVNRVRYAQMRDVIGKVCERAGRLEKGEALKIVEMGAGTGGTTRVLLPMLASLGISVEYTFTDLSSSMVANARRLWGKTYPFVRFSTHDIEQAPEEHLRGAHIVLASNAVHATHNLVTSLGNIRKALRPDGFVMLTEMTENVHFIDIPFGMLEGWWLFDDGREHAIVDEQHWEKAFHAAGFGHIDWTDGHLPEAAYQRVIIAMASGHQGERLPIGEPVDAMDPGDVTARTAEADRLVAKYSSGWDSPRLKVINSQREKTTKDPNSDKKNIGLGGVVLVTGATGSLGSHIVQKLAEDPAVSQVVCVNRSGTNTKSLPGLKRQQDAFATRGITVTPGARAKLRVMETDTSRAHLGLPPQEYAWLAQNVTHIVHNAWPMSATRPIGAYEPQFQAMRNLLDLAREAATMPGRAAANNAHRAPIAFQFVSSIGVVGLYNKGPRVPERRVPLGATLPSGYGEGKWVCERMLDETLHAYPALFRATVVRPGQISGSSASGYWNPVEHFAFLVKSAQSLRAWPDLKGTLQWIPVDVCGAAAAELVLNADARHPVYHLDNPAGQPWALMSPVLCRALGIPASDVVPFRSWIRRVRTSPLADAENPAGRQAMAAFLGGHFERMSCGGLILDVERAKEHSVTMACAGPVSPELAVRYIDMWRKIGFLY